MVREDQVAAAALDVDRRAEVVERDRGALDVPAGPAGRTASPRPARPGAPPARAGSRAGPSCRAGRGRRRARRTARASSRGRAGDRGRSPGRRRPRSRGRRRRRTPRPGPAGVRSARRRAGSPRPRRRSASGGSTRSAAMSSRNSSVSRSASSRQSTPVAAAALEQRVVDVGDVLDVAHLVAGVAPGPVEQVEGDVGGRVAEVGGVVRRDAADVHPGDRAGVGRQDATAGGVADPSGGPVPGRADGRARSRTAW